MTGTREFGNRFFVTLVDEVGLTMYSSEARAIVKTTSFVRVKSLLVL